MVLPTKWFQDILIKLRALDKEDRRIGIEILEILCAIERRKAYAELKYDGLFSFCVRELNYTESQAFQRIQAMWALKSVPELKEKIKSGAMSVTTVAQVQVFLRQEQAQGVRRDAVEKLELFAKFENKTSQTVKKELAELKGECVKVKLILELDEEAEFLWKEVRAKSVHSTQGDDLNCFKMLMKEWLDKRNRAQDRPLARPIQVRVKSQRGISGLTKVKHRESNVESSELKVEAGELKQSRYIPVALRKEIFARDQEKCANCGSKYALQVEHELPFAKGGEHEQTNLKILCRNCNLHQGVKEFGLNAMKR